MKVAHFRANVFEVQPQGHSECIFANGSYHPLDERTQRQVEVGNAVAIDAPDDIEKAMAAVERAQAKADSAVEAAEAAKAAVAAARAAVG